MKISNNPHINEKIFEKLNSGPLSFYDFMKIALYDPQGGFYSRIEKKFGKDGAFITSHYHGKWLGAVIAKQIKIILNEMMGPSNFKVVEYGPGEGLLAYDILESFRVNNESIDYILIEKSSHLAKKSRDLLSKFKKQISFSKNPPDSFEGVILAHEFLDAIPFHILQKTNRGYKEKYIILESEKLKYKLGPLSKPELFEHIKEIDKYIEIGQTFEVSLDTKVWFELISSKLKKGAVLIFDYGFSNQVIFDKTRFSGTARSFRKHTVSEVTLENVGESDITADVNFSFIIKTAEKLGFTLNGFTDQSHFCIGGGLIDLIEKESKSEPATNHKGVMGILDPTGLGSGIKVLLLTKGIDLKELEAFSMKPDDRASFNTLKN